MIKNRSSSFGMVSLLVIIPILIILSLVLQFVSIYTSFANDQSLLDHCEIGEELCMTSKVFSSLGIVGTMIMIIFMGVLLLCVIDAESGMKNKKCLFKSFPCQQLFIKYHNALIILIPLTLVFQLIAFGTEVKDVHEFASVEYQEGFSTYLVSIILVLLALFMHPFVNRAE